MGNFEQILILFAAAALLSAAARKLGVPYPIFLALGGAVLAFVPGTPTLSVPPELALALFVAPVLLDSAFDTSLRDLKDNWLPIISLVVFAVSLTTGAVALVVKFLLPDIPWAAAIALGAVVAPPDAVAATAVLRQLRPPPPHRIMTILEGESLLNDASALLIFHLAVSAVSEGSFSFVSIAPAFLLNVVGSLAVGYILGQVILRVTKRITHIPTSIILQFVYTFGVWILAEQLGLSGVLTMVCFAITIAQTSPTWTPARSRIPSYAVWETVVFALNILAFIFIGLQLRPILEGLEAAKQWPYFGVAGAVLVTVILVRIAWHMSYNTVMRLWYHRFGFHPPRPMLRPSLGTGLVISWAGMRGIVTLAAALSLPSTFPYRDLIVLTAFAVVLGTLVIQGLTLKPLLGLFDLHDDDPVGHEVAAARQRALEAGLATLQDSTSPIADVVRQEFTVHLEDPEIEGEGGTETASEGEGTEGASADGAKEPNSTRNILITHHELHRQALRAARQAVLAMRSGKEIGDDAFHQIEEELDWLDMAEG